MPSPIQNIETRLTALEAKIDQILAQPALPPEVNLEGLTNTLSGIYALCVEIHGYTQPAQPDLSAQVQQTVANLQSQIAQLQQQAQAIVIPEPVNPEPLIPEVM